MSTEEAFSPLAYPSLRDPERERLEAESRVRGHAAGYAAGLREAAAHAAAAAEQADEERLAAARTAAARIDAALGVLRSAASALTAASVPVIDSVEDALAAAAFELAEAVIGYELADGGNSTRSIVARALNAPLPFAVHTVRLHPADLARLTAAGVCPPEVQLVADPALAAGDAVAEYPDGFLDARISTAVARVRAALAGGAA
ncbi:FliH/SctL family protein [Arthrobacter zhaoguopingii]|uniref:FliH/SctL family protein n=1 Tax=Arthrobacter zhaoguopingii TaxID=2681491 RepID=UPI0013587247|nr:FliH/SctL family protein [Arthrobacter zhaoguopingii]